MSRAPPAKRRRPGSGTPPLSDHEQAILDLITSKGNEGILLRGIKFESKIPDTAVNRALKSLSDKALIKEVKSIKHMGRKIYMEAKCTPSKELSGGVWYEDGKLDKELVGHLQEFCKRHLQNRKVDTLEGIHKAVHEAKMLNIELPEAEMADLLNAMLLEDDIIDVKSTGLGVYHGIPVGETCYRIGSAGGKKKKTAAGEYSSVPCGMCPRMALCTPDGAISPATCVQYNKWVDININNH